MKEVDKIRKRIKKSRLKKGYSQDYVGEQLHISQVSYHKIESGKTELKIQTLIDLAIILKVKKSYLLGWD